MLAAALPRPHLCLITLAFACCLMSASEPAPYVKKATWQETLLASLEAASQQKSDNGPKLPLPDFGKDNFTLCAWVKTTSGGTIVAKAPAEGVWAPQGKSLFIRDGRVNYDIGWVACISSKTSVSDGQWHHVAFTGPQTYAFYIDGKFDARGDLHADPDPAGNVLKIGVTSTNFPAPSFFSGALDDVRIYARQLSAEQIKALFDQASTAGTEAGATSDGPVARWAFDGDLDDASGRGHPACAKGKVAFCEGKIGKALTLDGKTYLTTTGGKGALVSSELWSALQRDFSDEQSTRQMGWEKEDRIYEAGWSAPALASVYSKAARVPALAEQIQRLAATAKEISDLAPIREFYYRSRILNEIFPQARDLDTQALRAAIADLGTTFPTQYSAADYLKKLDDLERALVNPKSEIRNPQLDAQAASALRALRREALITKNPLLGFEKILFIKRKTYQASHYYTDYIDGCKYFGGNISTLSLRDGTVVDLIPELKDGIFGRFDLSYDAKRIVFDWKKTIETGFRIYEVGIDGKALRQLTFDAPDEAELVKKYRTVGTPTGIPYKSGTDDMHPCYLPDGDIAFVTTRCKKGILCDGPDVLTTTTLYRMEKDGKNMRPISFNSVSEATPTITQDGRILYTRWEYVDKGGSACKCIWAMYPDGRGSVEIYGNNIAHPVTFIDSRDIPGEPNLFVSVGAPHMPLGVGAILRIDTQYSLRTLQPITNLTPEIYCPDEHGYQHLKNGKWVHDMNGPLLREPYPLSKKYFLVTYNPDKPWNEPTGYGLYLLDEFGNRELIYKDPEFSCWGPYPLRPRPLPTQIPPVVPGYGTAGAEAGATAAHGTLLLQDVYVGMTGIERGRVKYLRVMEDIPRPWEARRTWSGDEIGQQHAAVSFGGHLAPKNTHGIVPVEEDGSAYFTVPADKNVFFQALDENYMELQRMRSFVNLRAGEYRGCVGCHEEKRVAPPIKTLPIAFQRSPSTPQAQPGETVPRPIHYVTDVQPILDKHCVSCHSTANPNKIDLSGTLTNLFSVSYESLLKKRWCGNVIDEIGISGTGGKHSNIASADPLTYGSHTSKLIELLRKGHEKVQLPKEDFIKLVTWIDANAPYYGGWEGRRNLKYKELPDFRPVPTCAGK
ncbi:MAG TPA: LamG-like jellyroll fold domain-containing protein [Planctomycetota bacterium]|jgi:hypothetical protein